MPKASKYPKLRVYVKRGKSGQVWTSYAYDMRGTGKPDVPLGNDYDLALERWAEIHINGPRIAGTLEEAFTLWEADTVDGLQADRLARHTRAGYAKCLRMLRPVFGAARWADVTLPLLAQYVRQRSAKARARQEMQLLSVIWGYARVQGLTDLLYPAIGMQRNAWKGLAGVRRVQVSDEAFAALYAHADPCLRDALDIASSTGLRVEDVIRLRLSDVRDGRLVVSAGKTGKEASFDLAGSVLAQIIERRKALRGTEHVFLLAAGRRPVTYRRLKDRFDRARAAAAEDLPEVAELWLRDMRKRAAQQAGTLAEASALLQHSSLSVTARHYRSTAETIKPVR
jgi:integrase